MNKTDAPERIFYRERLQNKNSLLVVSTECLGPDDVLYLRHDSEELVRLRRIAEVSAKYRAQVLGRTVERYSYGAELDALLSAQPKVGE